jgi:hypothetical protein
MMDKSQFTKGFLNKALPFIWTMCDKRKINKVKINSKSKNQSFPQTPLATKIFQEFLFILTPHEQQKILLTPD